MSSSMQPMYGAPPAPPAAGFQRLIMLEQSQGSASGDGMVQSGPATTARNAFLAELASSVTEPFTTIPIFGIGNIEPGNEITVLGGLGTLVGLPDVRDLSFPYYQCEVTQGGSNGRFNTTNELTQQYLETPYGFQITLSSPRTAFSCFMTDMGEAASAEVEVRFYSGSTLVRAIHGPTDHIQKPTSNTALFFAYADGGKPFNRIEVRLKNYTYSYSDEDWVGFDDITVGTAPDLTAVTPPAIYHGANTASDAASTVTGAALTARNAWMAAVGAAHTADFEGMATGVLGATSGGVVALPFSAGALSGATIASAWYSGASTTPPYIIRTDIAVNQNAEIRNTNSANRWNTTASGSKYLEWCEEISIILPSAVNSIGFYLTNIGNQNCTVRVMLIRTLPSGAAQRWGGPCYYVPKGAELNSPAGLLRFWGVVGELPFDRIVLQTIFYSSLTSEQQVFPPAFGVTPYARIGIDDIMVA